MATREEYENFLAEVRKQTGIEAMTSDDAGLVSVRVDEKYNVNLQFVEATGKVLCFIEVAELVYNYFFDLETAARDVEDFVSTLEKILQLCDVWAERIQTAVSTVETQSAEPSISHFDRFSIDQHFHIHP